MEGKKTDLVIAQIELEEHRQHEQLLKKENEFLKVGNIRNTILVLRIIQSKLVFKKILLNLLTFNRRRMLVIKEK